MCIYFNATLSIHPALCKLVFNSLWPLRVHLNCSCSQEYRRILDSLSNKSQNLAPCFFHCREAITAVWVSLWPCHVLTPPPDPMELFFSQDVCPAPSCYHRVLDDTLGGSILGKMALVFSHKLVILQWLLLLSNLCRTLQ